MNMITVRNLIYNLIDKVVNQKFYNNSPELFEILNKYKTYLSNILENDPKNANERNTIVNASREPIQIPGLPQKISLTQDYIQEAVIISDLFELNEMTAVELLLSGEAEMTSNPEMSRGLIAVLNYYNSQKTIVESLKSLLKTRLIISDDGAEFSEIINFIDTYTENLFRGGLFSRLIGLIRSLDISSEIDRLEGQRALGTAKHRRRFHQVFQEIRNGLAECVMLRSVRTAPGADDTRLLVGFVRDFYRVSAESERNVDRVLCHLLVALMNSINPVVVNGNSVNNYSKDCFSHPFFVDDDYIRSINDLMKPIEIREHESTTLVDSFNRVFYLAWIISLQKVVLLKQEKSINTTGGHSQPDFGEYEDLLEYDSNNLDPRTMNDCFCFLSRLVSVDGFHDEDIWINCFHDFVTDFIIYMPKMVKELRARQNIEYFSSLLNFIGCLHGAPERLCESLSNGNCNRFLVGLTLEFWCPQEIMTGSDIAMNLVFESAAGGETRFKNWAAKSNDSYRQASLFKFIRDCGDLFDHPEVFVNYLYMLKGLCNSERTALYIYKMLNSNQIGLHNSKLTWLWFTNSFSQYAKFYISNPHKMQIMDPMELEGLIVALQLIKRAIKMSAKVCELMVSSDSLMLIHNLILLLSCGVPKILKAELLNCLSVCCQNTLVTKSIWQSLDSNRIISSSPDSTGTSVLLELSDLEPKQEEFFVTRAFLNFLLSIVPHIVCDVSLLDQSVANYDRMNSSIISTPTHYSLVENLTTVLQSVTENVFVKHPMRTYRNIEEKFAICEGFLKLCCKCVELFLSQTGNSKNAKSKTSWYQYDPGFFVINQLLNETPFFKTIVHIIDSGYLQITDSLNNVTFGSRTLSSEAIELLSNSIALAMDLLSTVLKNESYLLEINSKFNSQIKSESYRFGLQFSRPRSSSSQELSQLLMRSCAQSFLPNLIKYVGIVDENEKLASKALTIFNHCIRLIQPHSNIMLMLTNVNDVNILPLMVNCLDMYGDIDETVDNIIANNKISKMFFDDQMTDTPRTLVLKILINCLQQPTPNLGQYLTGFSCSSVIAVKRTSLQEAGVGDFPKTCLHSILNLIRRLVLDMASNPFLEAGDIPAEYLSVFVVNMINLSLAYRILFLLASNTHTSMAVLRFIRSNYKFIFNQIDLLDFNTSRLTNMPELKALIWNQKSWLLKIIAIEIRLCSANQQQSQISKLLKLLFGDDFYSPSNGTSNSNGGPFLTWLSDENQSCDGLMYRLIEDLEVTEPENQIDFSNCQRLKSEILREYLNESLEDTYMGTQLMNSIKLKQMIFADINFAVDEEQFRILEQEIDNIYQVVDKYNTNVIWMHFGKTAAADAWGQVVEVVMLSECGGGSDDSIDLEMKRKKLFEILDIVNEKIIVPSTPSCLITPLSRVGLVLSAVFAGMFVSNQNKTGLQLKIMPDDEVYNSEENRLESIDMDSLFEQLKRLLKMTLKCIVDKNYKFQNTRIKFYAAFTYLLETVLTISRIKPQFSSLVDQCYLTINNHSLLLDKISEKSLYSTVCCDCISGNVHLALSSLSLLNSVASIDTSGGCLISYLVSHGYLNHFIDSLVRDCERIYLNMKHAHDANYMRDSDNPNDVIPYNLYLSRMCLLCTLASQPNSAKALVQCCALSTLSRCQLFRVRPTATGTYSESANAIGDCDEDSAEESSVQHRSIVSAVVQLVNNILASLGLDKTDAVREVLTLIGESIDCLCEPFYLIRCFSITDSIKEMIQISNLFVLLVPAVLRSSRSLEEIEFQYRTVEKIKRASSHAMVVLLGLLYRPIDNENEMMLQLLQMQLMTNCLSLAAAMVAPSSSESERFYFSSNIDDAIGSKNNWNSAIRKITQSVSCGNKPPLSVLVIVVHRMLECYELTYQKLTLLEQSDLDIGLQGNNDSNSARPRLVPREVQERLERMSRRQLEQLWGSVLDNTSRWQQLEIATTGSTHLLTTPFGEDIGLKKHSAAAEAAAVADLVTVHSRISNLLSSLARALEMCCFLLWSHAAAYKTCGDSSEGIASDVSLHPIQRLHKMHRAKIESDHSLRISHLTHSTSFHNEPTVGDIAATLSKCIDDDFLHRIQTTLAMHFGNEESASFSQILIHRLMRLLHLCS